MAESIAPKLHFAMFPWLAYGHFIPYLRLANELAKRGHEISFLLPKSAHLKLSKSNLHPELITLHPLSVPHVDGLPHGAETMSDTDDVITLSAAMDAMKDQVKVALVSRSPDFVVFDMADWIPVLASEIGVKALFFSIISPAMVSVSALMAASNERTLTPADFLSAIPNYPSSNKPVVIESEAHALSAFVNLPNNKMKEFFAKAASAMKRSHAIAMRTCLEIEGAHCEHLAKQYGKPVLCIGPLLPERKEEEIPIDIASWLERFGPGSVVFCVFGSEIVLETTQFRELVLGLELAGFPYLIAGTKPPKGTNSIPEALPEELQERVKAKGLGMLHEGWVPQTMILNHKSIGCFVTHGGSASMWESLVSDCRIVVAPIRGDYAMNARLMSEELGVAVQVEMGESGWFLKENLCKALKSAMDEDSQMSISLKENHKKWRDLLSSFGFADDYIDKFIQDLIGLLGH